MHGIAESRICSACSSSLPRILKVINTRTNVNISLRINEIKGGGSRKRLPAILRCEVIRSKKTGKQNEALERRQQDQCPHEFFLALQLITPHESADRSRRAIRPQIDFLPPGRWTRASPRQSPRRRPSPGSHPPVMVQYLASSGSLPPTA